MSRPLLLVALLLWMHFDGGRPLTAWWVIGVGLLRLGIGGVLRAVGPG